MADLLKRLKISQQQYGVGIEDNPLQVDWHNTKGIYR